MDFLKWVSTNELRLKTHKKPKLPNNCRIDIFILSQIRVPLLLNKADHANEFYSKQIKVLRKTIFVFITMF